MIITYFIIYNKATLCSDCWSFADVVIWTISTSTLVLDEDLVIFSVHVVTIVVEFSKPPTESLLPLPFDILIKGTWHSALELEKIVQ